jgi:tripartite-type tricarboxylate transporter receptor subunit TctC
VDNRPGASSNIAARSVVTAPADGYTLFLGTIANTINVSLQPGTSVDLSKELMPVSMIGSVPNILVVNPALGVDTMDQLLAKAKAEPGRCVLVDAAGDVDVVAARLWSILASRFNL